MGTSLIDVYEGFENGDPAQATMGILSLVPGGIDAMPRSIKNKIGDAITQLIRHNCFVAGTLVAMDDSSSAVAFEATTDTIAALPTERNWHSIALFGLGLAVTGWGYRNVAQRKRKKLNAIYASAIDRLMTDSNWLLGNEPTPPAPWRQPKALEKIAWQS